MATVWLRRPYHGGLVAFGSVFFLIGLGFLLFLVLPMLYDAQRMQQWQQVQGELLALDLRRNHSSDGTTYSVSARYQYQVQGQSWVGERVSLSMGSDNVGDYQQRLYQSLHAAAPEVTVWYDPADPADAILDPGMRWEMLAFKGIFVLAFGGAGLGLILFGLRQPALLLPQGDNPAVLRQRFREQNAEPRIYSGGIGVSVTLWVLAVGAAVFFWPGLWALRAGLAQGDGLAWFLLALVVVGLGLFVMALLTTLDYRRYGRLALVMDPFPGAIGGEFGATLELRERFDARTLFPVNLSCVHIYTRGSGKNRRQHRETLWHREGYAQILETGRGTRLGMRFAVPEHLPPSSPAGSNYHAWYLNVEASVPGIDLNRQFTVPMFPGTETSGTLAAITYADQSGPEVVIPDALLRLQSAARGTEFYYRMGRHKLGALLTGLTGAGFATGAVLAAQENAGGVLGLGLFSLILGTIALVLGAFSLYMPLNSLRVIASRSGIEVERRWLGLLLRKKHIDNQSIINIEAEKEMEIQGRKPVIHYRLVAYMQDGRKLTVGESLRGNRLADHVMDRLYAALDRS